jgi:hypothetical protein
VLEVGTPAIAFCDSLLTTHAGLLLYENILVDVENVRVQELMTPPPTVTNPAVFVPVIAGDLPQAVTAGAVLEADKTPLFIEVTLDEFTEK